MGIALGMLYTKFHKKRLCGFMGTVFPIFFLILKIM